MTPERWKEIERVYHEARQHEPSERTTYLDTACGGDAALRAEIESLLRYDPYAAQFIELPHGQEPRSAVAGMMARVRDRSAPGRFVGQALGSYELKSLIAAGGMGEVYRGIDVRLDRVVAIKILPDHFSEDQDRRERFTREARILSSLNHPHICALYDVGVQDGTQFLVMEHVDGETLHDRIRRGPVPVEQALEYLIQIADALDKAHRHGIVHRDLKPGNIMLTRSGVKLLDFGIAARRAGDSPAANDVLNGESARALTVAGTIQGTVQYMAPEQLRGQPSDPRSDIFAFGAVAYEMLTGKPAFDSTSRAGLISAILRDEPTPITGLVPDLPSSLARSLTRCLAKDPDERWQTATDLLFQFRSLASTSADTVPVSAPRLSRSHERAVWAAAVFIASSLAALFWTRGDDGAVRPSTAPGAPVRFSLPVAEGVLLSGLDVPFALSPDGRQIVYAGARRDGTSQLWLRSLHSDEQHLLPGTEGARAPFWSPDSEWVAFFAANSLKKVRVSTGIAQVIANDVSTVGGAAWGGGDAIVFSGSRGGFSRLSALGGPVSSLSPDEGNHFSPHFLSDGKHFVYASGVPRAIRISSVDGESPRTLMTFSERISSIGYAPGYIFFVDDATLFARPFDEERLDFSGEPIRILDGVPVTTPARAPFSVSATGVLAYWPFPLGAPAVLQWFDRKGQPSSAVDRPAQYRGFALSPDDSQLVVSRLGKAGGADLWLRRFADNRETQLTFEGAAYTPQWSPDAARIAFSGYGTRPPPKVFVKTLTDGAASRVGDTVLPDFVSSWSRDGLSIVSVRTQDPAWRNDLWIHRLAKGSSDRLPVNTRLNESHATISPDGRWIAYTTDESGKPEVWVATFPSGDNRRQISTAAGSHPQWGEKEIFYISSDKQLMTCRFSAGSAGVEIGTPHALFRIDNLAEIDPLMLPTVNAYVPAGNGQRFLIAVRPPDPISPPINIVVNWPAFVKR